MTDAERLAQVAAILGLLPADTDWYGRARYWAFLVASGSPDEEIAEARAVVEEMNPGWPDTALSFIKDTTSA